jgi:hypothetical protein
MEMCRTVSIGLRSIMVGCPPPGMTQVCIIRAFINYAFSCHVSPLRTLTPDSVPPHSSTLLSLSLFSAALSPRSESRMPGSSKTTLAMAAEKDGWEGEKRSKWGAEPNAIVAVFIKL